jgi:pimeloyl-ACP methyl ester carboxylesterase
VPIGESVAQGTGMARRSVSRRIAVATVMGAVGVAIAGTVAVAALASYVARVVITPPRKRAEEIRVLGYTSSTITLSVNDDTSARGRYGFWFNGDTGHVRVGEIHSIDEHSVTRELIAVDFGDLSLARQGRWSGWFYQNPRELGYPVEDIEIHTAVGIAPAWLVPAGRPSDHWVIQVHGRGVTRAETIRAVPVFRSAGYTSLLISYRNDSIAPDSEDRRYALGGTEWRDLEAAIEFAVSRGAKHIVLMGWSMGGATSLQASILSSYHHLFRGLVLESAVVDWRSVLDFQALQQKVPRPVRLGALRLLGSRWGRPFTGQSQPIDLDSLNIVRRASELTVQTLLLHSADDGYVPVDAARELAALRPDLVRYEEFAGARHAKLWNYDPERFNRVIADWLKDLKRANGRRVRWSRRGVAARD